MASIRVDYTLFLVNPDGERYGKMFVPIDLDCCREEMMEYVHEAIMGTFNDFDEVIGGKAVIHYFGATFDVIFCIKGDEECQTTIH